MSIFRRIFDGIHASREGSSAIKMFIKIREGFILNKVMSLHDAVAKYVENGDTLAIGGFTTNRKPYATVSEILPFGVSSPDQYGVGRSAAVEKYSTG